MMTVTRVTISEADAGQRLDRWFRRAYPEVSHGHLQKLLRSGQIRIDGRRAKASLRLEAGQDVRIPPLAPGDETAARRAQAKQSGRRPPVGEKEGRALRAALLYRDDWMMALDKAAGLAVQGGSGQQRHLDAMLDALRFGAGERPRLVHRLDKDTSGVLLLARNARAARRLTESFRDKKARKVYWALVAGVPRKTRGVIDLALAKQGGPGREKAGPDAAAARPATTLYHLIQRHGGVSWLILMPLTGRTHQLRAHCALSGMPIIGDGKYGGAKAFPAQPALPKRLMLHAREIALPHPDDGTTIRVSAPLPAQLAEAWQRLGFEEARGEDALHGLLDYAANFG